MKKDMNNLLSISISQNREIEIGKELEINVKISKSIGQISDFEVLFNQYGEEPSIKNQMIKVKEENNFEEYCAKTQFNKLGNYFFFFLIKIDGKQKAIKLNRENMEQPIILYPEEEAPYWKVLVTNEFSTPNWATDAIFYQAFVDRFCKEESQKNKKNPCRNYLPWEAPVKWERAENGEFNNNDFRGGNLRGVISKLEYLKKLGVKVIYLSPINKSKDRYDGYATIDHMKIDEDIGNFEDLKELHDKAREHGMYVILDMAFNHLSTSNVIFREAKCNPKPKYRDWFYFHENGEYEYWYDFKDMPILNQDNLSYQKYVYGPKGIIDKYSQYVDGFRLDLAELLKPFFLEGIKKRANLNGHQLIVAEAWGKMPIEILGKGIDATTNYSMLDPILKYVKYGYYQYLKDEIYNNEENPMTTIDTSLTSLGTHDTPRALTMLSDRYQVEGFKKMWEIDKEWSQWHYRDENGNVKFDTDKFREFEYQNDDLTQEEYETAKSRLKIAVLLQYFLPGNPCIYYGDEVGVTGYKDPFSRKPYPYGNEDLELLEFYQKLGAFRNLYQGAGSKIQVLECDENLFSFRRDNEKNTIFVAVNRGNTTRTINIPEDLKEGTKIFKLNGDNNYLLPNGGIVILK